MNKDKERADTLLRGLKAVIRELKEEPPFINGSRDQAISIATHALDRARSMKLVQADHCGGLRTILK